MKIMKRILAAMLSMIVVMSLSGCGTFEINKIVATVNGEKITEGEFKYYLETAKQEVKSDNQEASQQENFWDSEIDGKKASDIAKDKALEEVVRSAVASIKAKEFGVTVPAEVSNNIKSLFTATDANMQSQIKDLRKKTGLSSEMLKQTLLKSSISSQLLTYLQENDADSVTPAEDEIQSTYTNDYVMVKHVLIPLSKTNAADAAASPAATEDPEVVKAAQKALAEEVLAKAKAGSGFEDLILEYCEDPGMVDTNAETGAKTVKEGYLVSTNSGFVPEFEAAALKLADGEVSDIVETSYGFHILKRYPLPAEGENYDNAMTSIKNVKTTDMFNVYVDKYKESCDVKVDTDAISKIKVTD